MIRDPFYRDVTERLQGTVDPDTFELCAADLLRGAYATLVPVRGGHDSGMDGAIADTLGEPFPLVSTTGKDVIGNLTRNLNSYLDSGGPRRKVLLATSQALTPQRIRNLYKRARGLGFTLLQVYEQSAMALLLYSSPKWCLELLNLTGHPPALSAIPKTQRPLLNQVPIGRDQEISWSQETEGDRLLVGQPGSGKTFVARRLVSEHDALFLVSDDRAEIANAIRSQQPKTVIVDDAQVALAALGDLKQIRDETGVEFSILATCWPGDRSLLVRALNLPTSQTLDLKQLTRDEIVEIIRDVGLAGPDSLIRELVTQSEGRPGLAVTLANLCLAGGVREVVTGDKLAETTLVIAAQTAGTEAGVILGAFSLGGETGVPMATVAEHLGLSLAVVQATVVSLSTAGIIYEADPRRLSVRPPPLRHVLVKDVFFSGAASFPIEPLLQRVSDREEAARTLIGATARGAPVPQELLQGVIGSVGSDRLLADYSSLGADESTWVLQRYPGKVISVARTALIFAPDKVIPLLLDLAVGDRRGLGSTPDHPLRLIRDWVHGVSPGTGEGVNRRRALVGVTRSWLELGRDATVGSHAMAIALSPVFENVSVDPGIGDTVTIRSGLLTKEELGEIQRLWSEAQESFKIAEITDWTPLQRVIWDWAFPGRHSASADASEASVTAAGQMLRDIVALADGQAGLLAWVKDTARRIGDLNIEIPSTADFDTLYPGESIDPPGDSVDEWIDDWKAAQKRQEADVDELAAEWSMLPREQVVSRIAVIEKEARASELTWPRWTPRVCEKIAEAVDSPVEWASDLLDLGVSGDLFLPFLRRAAEANHPGWTEVASSALEADRTRLAIVSLILTLAEPPEALLSAALKRMDGSALFVKNHCIRLEVSEEIVRRLLAHDRPDVASAAALGEWEATPYGTARESLIDDWRRAIIRATDDDFWLSQVLKDSSLARDWLAQRVSEQYAELYRLEKAVGTAMQALSLDDRRELLNDLSPSYYSSLDLVRRLVGGELELYRGLLADARLKQLHLCPLAGHPDAVWTEKAKLALDAGYSPRDVAAAVVTYPMGWSGELSAMWADWVDVFTQLERDGDERIQSVGAAGRASAESSQNAALEEERSEAVRGRAW